MVFCVFSYDLLMYVVVLFTCCVECRSVGPALRDHKVPILSNEVNLNVKKVRESLDKTFSLHMQSSSCSMWHRAADRRGF